MKIEIENMAEEKGKIIAKAIIEKYDEYSYSYEIRKVQKEVYERALHEATVFFINNGQMKFDDEIIKILKYRLEIRLKKPKEIKKLNPEEMLANVIRIYVIDFLLEWNSIVI